MCNSIKGITLVGIHCLGVHLYQSAKDVNSSQSFDYLTLSPCFTIRLADLRSTVSQNRFRQEYVSPVRNSRQILSARIGFKRCIISWESRHFIWNSRPRKNNGLYPSLLCISSVIFESLGLWCAFPHQPITYMLHISFRSMSFKYYLLSVLSQIHQ